jgi:predicted nuclease with TOPRIM domain
MNRNNVEFKQKNRSSMKVNCLVQTPIHWYEDIKNNIRDKDLKISELNDICKNLTNKMRNYIEQNENLASSKDAEFIGMEDKVSKLESENRDLLENIKRNNKDSRNIKTKTDEIEAEKQE